MLQLFCVIEKPYIEVCTPGGLKFTPPPIIIRCFPSPDVKAEKRVPRGPTPR